MLKGRAITDITNTVMDVTATLAHRGETVYIHEDHGSAYEVSTEANPSLTFWASKSQVEVTHDGS